MIHSVLLVESPSCLVLMNVEDAVTSRHLWGFSHILNDFLRTDSVPLGSYSMPEIDGT